MVCSLSVSSVSRNRGGGERGNWFHCSVEKHCLDRRGILPPVMEKIVCTFLSKLTGSLCRM